MIGKEQPPQAAEPVDEAFGSRRTAPEQRDSGSLSATRQHTQVRKRASETTSSGVMGRLGGMLSTLTASQPDTNERARNQQLCDENKALTEDNIKLKAAVSRLEARCTHVEHRKREYRAHCAEVEKSKQEMEQQAAILTQHRDRLHSENAELHDAVQKTLADQESLREQVLHYKKMISHTTRTEDQVSDEIIKDEAGQIYFHVQNFAVKYFRTARFNYDALPEALKSWMRDYVPGASTLPANCSIKIASSVIMKTVTSRFEPRYCFGSSGEELIQAATMLAKLQPQGHLATKPWIELTRKLIAQSDNAVLERAVNALVCDMLQEVHYNLGRALGVDWPSNLQNDLAKIFVSCLDFFRILHRQSAMFSVRMVCNTDNDGTPGRIGPEWMEDVNNEDEDDVKGRGIEFSLFPAIYKKGDERGENARLPWIPISKTIH